MKVLFLLISILLVLPFCSSKADLRIFGGEKISIDKAPYIAALCENEFEGHFCGATIISPRVLATAAHCLLEPSQVETVRVGSEYDDKGGDLYEVESVFKHENYSKDGKAKFADSYDYGVVVLKSPIKFGENVSAAELATETLPDGTIVTVAGWGSGHKLEQTRVPLYNQTECIENYGYIPIIMDPNVTLCAGFENAQSGPCQGDSGGPLIHGERTLYGITSWGDEYCALERYPAVYARVTTMTAFFQGYIEQFP